MLFLAQKNKNRLAGLMLLLTSGWLVAEQDTMYGVMYPRSHGSYQSVFRSVITGVESALPDGINTIVIDDSADMDKVRNWTKKNRIDVLISLANQGLDLCAGMPTEIQLIAGAILSPPEADCRIRGGITLAPHPEKLFQWLKRLNTEVKTVYVVYNPAFNDWLIVYAQAAAGRENITLITHQAESLDQAAKLYRQIIRSGLGRTDAIWLPQDPYTVDDKSILPSLLKDSWNDGFMVFSSNAAHVKRGVLFGLYPDFEAMGASLGRLALQYGAGQGIKDSGIRPLMDVLIAVNLRTADHLNLNLKSSERDEFDLTFPVMR